MRNWRSFFQLWKFRVPWTGRRGVSLPFTGVCFPLQTIQHDRRVLYELALEHGRRRNWKSLECRGNNPEWQGASPSLAFYGHVIDLKHDQEALFKSEAIKRCADSRFDSLHLGRTSVTNEGLRRFKLGFGACEEKIEYYKCDFVRQIFVKEVDCSAGWFKWPFGYMPLPALRLAGEMLYPHMS